MHIVNSVYRVIFFFKLILNLFLSALGLRCCVRDFSSCGERELLFVAVRAWASYCGAQALGAWASVDVARGLSSCGSRVLECRLSSCGTRA